MSSSCWLFWYSFSSAQDLPFTCYGLRPSCSPWCGSPASPSVAVKAPAAGRFVGKRLGVGIRYRMPWRRTGSQPSLLAGS